MKKKSSMETYYSLFEMIFSNHWQWVRQRSKCFWVRDSRVAGGSWVKFDDEQIKHHGELLGVRDWKPTFEGAEYEDWRVK